MPGKKKKPTKSESESEVSEKEESEEEQDDNSEEEEDEDKGSDEEEEDEEEDEDEDEDNEESEEKSDKSEESGESEDEDKSSSSSKSSKSGSSDESKSGSDESDGSEKKAKKKKSKKDKDKSKKGKKGKEEPVIEKKKTSSKNELPPEPPKLTIASVFQDLDDLSIHLAKTFESFNGEKEVKEVKKQPSPSPLSPERKNDSPLGIPSHRPPHHSATLPGGYGNKTQLKPLVDDTGVQCEPEPIEKKQASPEAIRAVQEYKQRKELERQRKESPSPEEPVAIKNESQINKGKPRDDSQPRRRENDEDYERARREERKREQNEAIDFKRRTISPKRTGPNWTRANQIAEDYYASLYKKSAKNPVSGQKTIHDLYKYKPKPAFAEDDSQAIVQYTESDFRRTRDQPTFDVYDPRLKHQNEYSHKYNPLNSNKKPINDAMDVLARKSRNNNKF